LSSRPWRSPAGAATGNACATGQLCFESEAVHRMSDIAVIITAISDRKISDGHPYLWRYTVRMALLIFDHLPTMCGT
jgi:hypothetical protein